MTSLHKRYELGRSKSLSSPVLQLITAHLSRTDIDTTPVKPKKFRKMLRIYNSSKYNIFDSSLDHSSLDQRSLDHNDKQTTTSSTTASSTTAAPNPKKSCYSTISRMTFTPSSTTSSSTTTTTSSSTATAGVTKESDNKASPPTDGDNKDGDNKDGDNIRHEMEADNIFARGMNVSRSGRFREKMRARGRVFSMDGLSLLSVDETIVKQSNEEHLNNRHSALKLSQTEFSFLNDEESNRQPEHQVALSVVACKEFEGQL